MNVHFRHLQLRAVTSDGVFGADLSFRLGLNILSANNTSGKSTCFQAILYALGLEKMLGPKRDIPLPYVMQDRVRLDKTTMGPNVIESWVSLEVENSNGEILTIKRMVKGDQDWRLISTWNGPKISNPEFPLKQQDFFVRDPGTVQREAGFHNYLTKFFGWVLPEVQNFDDGFVPLYLETIFPLLFVEQKAGWANIIGPFPTFLRIREVGKRVMEFLLGLDAQKVRVKKRELEVLVIENRQKWKDVRSSINRFVTQSNARVQGIPIDPNMEFGVQQQVQIQIYRESDWRDINSILQSDRERLIQLNEMIVPTTEEASGDLEAELISLRDNLESMSAQRDAIFSELGRERSGQSSITYRLEALESDLRKNKDAVKLKEFGSVLGSVTDSGLCPTCHQTVARELLPPGTSEAMALGENIRFIESQVNLYQAMSKSNKKKVEDLDGLFRAINQEIASLRSRIRTIRSALIAPNLAPSEALIKEKLELEESIESKEKLTQWVSEEVQELISLIDEYGNVKRELASLPRSDLSPKDKQKFALLNTYLQNHLTKYGFSTFNPTDVSISNESFRPLGKIQDDDFETEADLGFQMSASDAIRMKWAYLLSVFELGTEFEAQHPGFLIFDEPRQQEAERFSFDELIKQAYRCAGTEKQVIFATTESPEELHGAIEHLDVNLLRYEGLILNKVNS